jgi:hypothetical protein
MNVKAFCLTAIMTAAVAPPASAHHSFAMFDAEKNVTVTGTVKEFEWTNPHSWLRVMVNDRASGRSVQWAIELGPPAQEAQRGWKADSVKPGDKVAITMRPSKDGSRVGQLLTAVLPDGRKYVSVEITNGQFGFNRPVEARPAPRLPGKSGGPPAE